MKNFGEQMEDLSQEPRQVYLGKRSFAVLAVNPDEAWMKDRGIYVREGDIASRTEMVPANKANPDGQKVRGARLDIFIRDAFSEENKDILRTSIYLQERYNVSNDGLKCQIINRYGSTLWVPVEEAKTLKISNPFIGTSPYVLDSIKPAYVGEESLITFIRTVRNLNNVRHDTKEEDKLKLPSLFDKNDLDNIFKGNFKDIASLIMAGVPVVGYVLGAKTSDKGSVYQDIFRDIPLRPYAVKATNNDYIIKKISERQAAGGYPNTFFDLNDLSFRPYSPDADEVETTADNDLFSGGSGFAGNEGFGEDPFAPSDVPAGETQEDDGFLM
jgi:hypothetical protein